MLSDHEALLLFPIFLLILIIIIMISLILSVLPVLCLLHVDAVEGQAFLWYQIIELASIFGQVLHWRHLVDLILDEMRTLKHNLRCWLLLYGVWLIILVLYMYRFGLALIISMLLNVFLSILIRKIVEQLLIFHLLLGLVAPGHSSLKVVIAAAAAITVHCISLLLLLWGLLLQWQLLCKDHHFRVQLVAQTLVVCQDLVNLVVVSLDLP